MDAAQLLAKGYRSISVQALEELLTMCTQMMRDNGVPEPARGYNSEHLKRFQAKSGIHFPELLKAKFSLEPPDHVITYMWLGTSLRELLAILKRLHRGRFADGQGKVWLDAVFNDQRSPQVWTAQPSSIMHSGAHAHHLQINCTAALNSPPGRRASCLPRMRRSNAWQRHATSVAV